MSLFTIPIWSLTTSFVGDKQDLEFEWDVPASLYEDLEFITPLHIKLSLYNLDDGIEAIFTALESHVKFDGKKYDIALPQFSRNFKEKKEITDPDDILQMNTKHQTIDITNIIREEILIDVMNRS